MFVTWSQRDAGNRPGCLRSSPLLQEQKASMCLFEHVYFARLIRSFLPLGERTRHKMGSDWRLNILLMQI